MAEGFPGHRGITRPDGSTPDAWFGYHCAHCDSQASGAVVAVLATNVTRLGKTESRHIRWLLCPECVSGSVQNGPVVEPGASFGPRLEGLPDDVAAAYNEARNCMRVNAFTAAELICRKILMHVAVEKKAKEGESFESYLSHLQSEGYVTPPMRQWVDLIRRHGNESTHKLAAPDQGRAESTVMFTAELLRLVYEMEHLAKRYAKPNPAGT